ncbi:MAG: HIT family protein [Spirochaetales bacterium]|nr:HIT family protein [Spirochaetales bacterium]
MYDDQNIFARILRGELPCYKLYEDAVCLAFLDIFPVNPGHLLVIPKQKAVSLSELDAATAGHLLMTAQKLADSLRVSGVRCEGVNFWLSDGAEAGQEVPHVHLHVIPRFKGDGFGWKVGPNNRKALPAGELEALASAICRAQGGVPCS